ncbi:MAG: HEAT repeat domain-containing protein [Anaerolineae bacterium]|jgi:HEAT repeat protein|nr:HEAT repeat domain-containing protein [Anaerolineae bacterium]
MNDFLPDIWRLQANSDIDGLSQALNNADATIRKRAAAALRALGAFSAISALEGALDRETDPETRSTILAALSILQQEKERKDLNPQETMEMMAIRTIDPEIQRLIDDLNGADNLKAIRAAQVLSDKSAKEAVEPMVMRFNSPKTPITVRLALAEALLKLESAPVEVALLGALRSTEWQVRRNGAAILGQLRAQWAIEPLAKAMFDANETVRKTAYAALKRINTPQAQRAIQLVQQRYAQKAKANTPPTPTDSSPPLVWPHKHTDVHSMQTKPLDPDVLKNSPNYKDEES